MKNKYDQQIVPFLWFDKNAEEAMNFYTSIFKDSKVKGVSRFTDAGPGPKGQAMVCSFELNGQEYVNEIFGIGGHTRYTRRLHHR